MIDCVHGPVQGSAADMRHNLHVELTLRRCAAAAARLARCRALSGCTTTSCLTARPWRAQRSSETVRRQAAGVQQCAAPLPLCRCVVHTRHVLEFSSQRGCGAVTACSMQRFCCAVCASQLQASWSCQPVTPRCQGLGLRLYQLKYNCTHLKGPLLWSHHACMHAGV